ncbi:mitochondrial carrier domain-containing protein [Blastocladiella britannica]|nr:mitochondrial carrier domain-containing protein [Blastocladiella britannica]
MESISPTLHNLGASSMAAIAARLASHPFDTVKTRIMADPSATVRSVAGSSGGFASTARAIVAHDGLAALYRGLPISLAFSMPAVSAYLWVYDASKAAIDANPLLPFSASSPMTHFTAAILAELCSGLMWTPLELIKSKQQCSMSASSSSSSSSSTSPYPPSKSVRDIATRIYRQDGLIGFVKGYWISIMVFVPYSIVYFGTYEQLKAAFASRQPPPSPQPPTTDSIGFRSQPPSLPFYAYMASAAVAGGLAAAISNPLDRIKTVIQVSDTPVTGPTARAGRLLQVARSLVAAEGWVGAFSRGLTSRVIWAVPNTVVAMAVYEGLKVAVPRKKY